MEVGMLLYVYTGFARGMRPRLALLIRLSISFQRRLDIAGFNNLYLARYTLMELVRTWNDEKRFQADSRKW